MSFRVQILSFERHEFQGDRYVSVYRWYTETVCDTLTEALNECVALSARGARHRILTEEEYQGGLRSPTVVADRSLAGSF